MDPFPGILDAGSDKEFPWAKGFKKNWWATNWWATGGLFCRFWHFLLSYYNVRKEVEHDHGKEQHKIERPVPFPYRPAIHRCDGHL
jgi:hypothetical protein